MFFSIKIDTLAKVVRDSLTKMGVKDELQQYLSWVEWETKKSLRKIRAALERSGSNFDKKFVDRFIRFTMNRICEAFDNIEVDATLHVQSNDQPERKKRGYTESDDGMGMRKRVRSKSPLIGSCSGNSIRATGSTNGIRGEEAQKANEQKHNESETSLSDTLLINLYCADQNEAQTSTPRKSTPNSVHGSIENGKGIVKQDGCNGDGIEQIDESIAKKSVEYENRIDHEHDQNRSMDSGINSNGTSAFDCGKSSAKFGIFFKILVVLKRQSDLR